MSKQARIRKKERRATRKDSQMTAWEYDQLYPDEDPGHDNCWRCGGDGYIDGMELADEDPLWYDAGEFYTCNCCGGSGNADDCTYW